MTPSSPPPAAPRAPAPPPAPPTAQGQTLIRHGYNPKAAHGPATSSQPGQQQQQQQGGGGQTGSGNFLISPITGEKIPAEKMQEHMRYGQCSSLFDKIQQMVDWCVDSFVLCYFMELKIPNITRVHFVSKI